MPTKGYTELSRQLSAMGRAVGSKALRSAAMTATLPARNALRDAAPAANPPYEYKTETGARQVDPYPKATYKGRKVAPGFTRRNIVRKSRLSRDKRRVWISLGVAQEAFYAVNFYEFGTSKFPKKPWMEPAFNRSIGAIDSRFRARLKQLIDNAARRK